MYIHCLHVFVRVPAYVFILVQVGVCAYVVRGWPFEHIVHVLSEHTWSHLLPSNISPDSSILEGGMLLTRALSAEYLLVEDNFSVVPAANTI